MSLRGEMEVKKVLEALPGRSLLDLYNCREELGEILDVVMEQRLGETTPSSEHPVTSRPRKKRTMHRNGRKKGRKRRARKNKK